MQTPSMNQTTRDTGIPLAPILLAPFRERFLKDGNIYDVYNQSRFSIEEKEALIKKHPILTNTKCYDFAKKAYAHHPDEDAFRTYIGVLRPCENVR